MNTIQKPKGKLRNAVKKAGKKLLRGTVLDFLSRSSLVPNDPVIGNEHFAWAQAFTERYPAIRRELEAQLTNRAALPNFQEISPDQYRISPDSLWKTFVLVGFGVRSELNCGLCPETARALDMVPNLETAFFSILAPGKHIPLHRGVTKGMVRAHLGLRVPRDAEHCYMDCGDERIVWQEGDLVFFDDTYPHAVRNDTDEERAVLLFDFERPMTRPGRFVSRLMMWGLRQTAYCKDAQRNQRDWERRYREFIARQAGERTPAGAA